MARTKDEGGSALERLRQFGLRYPGAHTKSPWPGHLDLAVNDKTFAYLSIAGEPLRISCKLPRSADAALELPFTTPTAYGLGKSGWVTAEFPDGTSVPVELLEEWIDESYRAQAPKRSSAQVPPLGSRASVDGSPAAPEQLELDEAPAPSPTARAGGRRPASRSTVKRAGARAATPTRGSQRRVVEKAAKGPAAADGASPRSKARATNVRATKAKTSKAKAGAPGSSKRQPLRAAPGGRVKGDGDRRQASKRPAKKRAQPRA